MKRVVVISERGWSVDRVHNDVAFYLAEHYEFKYHDILRFSIEEFLRDFHESDLCLTNVGWFEEFVYMTNLTEIRNQQKIVLVCHGHAEIGRAKWLPHITYGTVSDVLLPFMPVSSHVVPNGVNSSLFEHKVRDGNIKLLGYCGHLFHVAKRSKSVFEIARQSHLPVSVAETLTLQDLKDWYHSIDVLLVTSGPGRHIETGPLPPFEAIVSGVAVIGTRVGNFSKVPGPKFETVEEAVQILNDLKVHPEKVREIAHDQYVWVTANWTYQTLAESWKTMLDAAVAKQTRFLDFIEVGTSDFDTEIEKKDDKVGVSIEPIKHYLDRLPNKRGCRKLNIGISDYTGTCDVNFVSEEMIHKLGFPEWVKGCNCINSYHKTVSRLCVDKSIDIASITTTQTVPVRTLFDVMQSLDFDGVYLLKIDTEGHDVVILKKFVQEFNGDKKFLPHVIQFESNVLTQTEEVDETIGLLASIGYDLIEKGHDTVLCRNLQTQCKERFSNIICNSYVMDYPANYNVLDLPHANTLEAAKEFCVVNSCTGVTFEAGVYQVRAGKYLKSTELDSCSWIFE